MRLGFRKSKQKDLALGANPEFPAVSRLRELCGEDTDLYEAMSRLMFLDPKKILTPLDRVLSETQDYESRGNKLRAEVGYRIAGGISLYKGDLDGVQKYFSKAASFAGDSHVDYQLILKRSSKAVDIARKYYEEFSSTVAQT